jgi:hypothetical protein
MGELKNWEIETCRNAENETLRNGENKEIQKSNAEEKCGVICLRA